MNGLNELENKYKENKFRDILTFLSNDEIENYSRLILTLIVMEEDLSKSY